MSLARGDAMVQARSFPCEHAVLRWQLSATGLPFLECELCGTVVALDSLDASVRAQFLRSRPSGGESV
jgi:hypothetical protein